MNLKEAFRFQKKLRELFVEAMGILPIPDNVTKVVTTINYDRKKVKKLAIQLSEQADGISTRLDVAQVTTQVDYRLPFNVNDSFESVFEQFCEQHGKH